MVEQLVTVVGDEQEAQLVAQYASELALAQDEVVLRQGDPPWEVVLILDGTAEVVHDGDRVATVGPGEFVGEMGVLDDRERRATVRAETPMRLAVLSAWDLARLEGRADGFLGRLRAVARHRVGVSPDFP